MNMGDASSLRLKSIILIALATQHWYLVSFWCHIYSLSVKKSEQDEEIQNMYEIVAEFEMFTLKRVFVCKSVEQNFAFGWLHYTVSVAHSFSPYLVVYLLTNSTLNVFIFDFSTITNTKLRMLNMHIKILLNIVKLKVVHPIMIHLEIVYSNVWPWLQSQITW